MMTSERTSLFGSIPSGDSGYHFPGRLRHALRNVGDASLPVFSCLAGVHSVAPLLRAERDVTLPGLVYPPSAVQCASRKSGESCMDAVATYALTACLCPLHRSRCTGSRPTSPKTVRKVEWVVNLVPVVGIASKKVRYLCDFTLRTKRRRRLCWLIQARLYSTVAFK